MHIHWISPGCSLRLRFLILNRILSRALDSVNWTSNLNSDWLILFSFIGATPINCQLFPVNKMWSYMCFSCRLVTPCTSDPCQHQGSCIVKENGSYFCQCFGPYYGDNCEKGNNIAGEIWKLQSCSWWIWYWDQPPYFIICFAALKLLFRET